MKKVVLFYALVSLLLTGCFKHNEPWEKLDNNDQELYFVNQFGVSMMSAYYLWNKEVEKDLESWRYDSDPITKTREVRYKDASGNEIDKWSQMTDNFEAFQGQVSGNTKSTGMEFFLCYADNTKQKVLMVVTFTYPDSPAEAAGLKRGDAIVALNNTEITAENYKNLILNGLEGGSPCIVTMADGSTKSLTAKAMYFNPVQCHKVIEKDGRKIGYLHYTSFTIKSIPVLIDVFKGFKAAGISELVLDLRYNGGGYTITSEALASMIVPQSELDAESVFQREIYNDALMKDWGEEETTFSTKFPYEDENGNGQEVSTAGANPGISKLYVIMTKGSASASEALVCGLLPYMDIDIIGERSGGKYCGGIIVDGPTFYQWVKKDIGEKTYNAAVKNTNNWGIYVMISRYADRNGNTPCMPDGFAPDLAVEDNPLDGFQLGDENETMLSVALNGLPAKARSAGTIRNQVFYTSKHPEVRILNTRNILDK